GRRREIDPEVHAGVLLQGRSPTRGSPTPPRMRRRAGHHSLMPPDGVSGTNTASISTGRVGPPLVVDGNVEVKSSPPSTRKLTIARVPTRVGNIWFSTISAS